MPQPARWTDEGGALVVRDAEDAVRMRVVKQSSDRLVVEMGRRGPQRLCLARRRPVNAAYTSSIAWRWRAVRC